MSKWRVTRTHKERLATGDHVGGTLRKLDEHAPSLHITFRVALDGTVTVQEASYLQDGWREATPITLKRGDSFYVVLQREDNE